MKQQAFLKSLFIVFIAVLFAHNLKAQEEVYTDKNAPDRPKIQIGIGGGMLNYYGDIGYNKVTQPMKFTGGYSIDAQYNITRHYGLDLFLMGGTVSGEENSIARNLNFKSQLFNEGLIFRYSFCPKDPYESPAVTPFIGVGIGYLSYVTKSDLLDANGNNYYYWADGSIRNVPQGTLLPIGDSALRLSRDYTYETEVGSGNSITIPLNIGFKFQLSRKFFVRFQETFNFTLTNKIDYVQVNQFVGNHSYDNFLYSSLTINYDIGAFTDEEHSKYDYSRVEYNAITPEPKPAAATTPSKPATTANPATTNNIPEDLRAFDTNNDHKIEAAEINNAIDQFFESNGKIKIEVIYKLIDYFFDQK